jgi:FixJ family two-component response regulator
MAYTTIFVASDDPAVRDSLTELVASAGLRAEAFPSLETWLEAVPSKPRGCLLLDATVWDVTGPDRLARLTTTCAGLPLLLLVDRGDVPTAVRAIKVMHDDTGWTDFGAYLGGAALGHPTPKAN